MRAALVVVLLTIACASCRQRTPEPDEEPVRMEERVERAIPTGVDLLAEGEGRDLVAERCTGCHSTRLILQTRQGRGAWEETLRWMQGHHNLQAFAPEDEARILDYLATQYGPREGPAWARRVPIPPRLMPPRAPEAREAAQSGEEE